MREKRLLERLRAIEEHPDWRGDVDLQEAMASVLNHLRHLLNTRQGSVAIAQDYGIPDFTNIASSFGTSDIPKIEKMLENVIIKYEPRLENVTIQFTPLPDKPLTVVFHLNAKLKIHGGGASIAFETVLRPDGHIEISNAS